MHSVVSSKHISVQRDFHHCFGGGMRQTDQARQDKTRQDQTRPDKSRQGPDKTRQTDKQTDRQTDRQIDK